MTIKTNNSKKNDPSRQYSNSLLLGEIFANIYTKQGVSLLHSAELGVCHRGRVVSSGNSAHHSLSFRNDGAFIFSQCMAEAAAAKMAGRREQAAPHATRFLSLGCAALSWNSRNLWPILVTVTVGAITNAVRPLRWVFLIRPGQKRQRRRR